MAPNSLFISPFRASNSVSLSPFRASNSVSISPFRGTLWSVVLCVCLISCPNPLEVVCPARYLINYQLAPYHYSTGDDYIKHSQGTRRGPLLSFCLWSGTSHFSQMECIYGFLDEKWLKHESSIITTSIILIALIVHVCNTQNSILLDKSTIHSDAVTLLLL